MLDIDRFFGECIVKKRVMKEMKNILVNDDEMKDYILWIFLKEELSRVEE